MDLPIPNVLVTADDVERGKPAPDGYLFAAERLGFTADQCVVVEDTPPGIQAACAAGMVVIGLAMSYSIKSIRQASVIVGSLRDIEVSVQPTRRNDQSGSAPLIIRLHTSMASGAR